MLDTVYHRNSPRSQVNQYEVFFASFFLSSTANELARIIYHSFIQIHEELTGIWEFFQKQPKQENFHSRLRYYN
jgi:hypothetical protein